MQGPPTSPAFFSPPVKKQRAGSSPQSRRAQLQKLAQSPPSQVPSAGSLMDRARSSLSGPPVLPAGTLPGSAPPRTSNGTRPPMASPPNGSGPPISTSFFQPKKEPSASENRNPPVLGDLKNQGGTVSSAPPIPPAAAAQRRESDIFPAVQKEAAPPPPAQPSPKTPQPVTTPQVTVSALKAGAPSTTEADAQIARRLEMQFTPNRGARSKSAPPARPPPPPRTPAPPPPSKSLKSVTFSSPVAATTERPPEETPAPPPPMNGTPFPSKSIRDAGHTPFHSLKEESSPASEGRDMFLKMREAADTPAPKQQPSPELRLQQQLSSANKEKAQAFRQVTELQGELQRANERSVGFLSPILDKPRRNIRKTPHPKRRSSDNDNSAREIECLIAAAKTLPFEYEPQEVETTSFSVKIRRPFGLDASSGADEQDTWFRYGRLNSKMYRQSATIENETTLEAATSPLPDGSVLSVHGMEQRVHHHSDGTSLEDVLLLPVQYIDDEGNDKEFDLDAAFENLMAARSSYCMALRSAGDALLLQPPQAQQQPPGAPEAPTTAAAAPAQQKETADVGIETEPLDFGPPPPPQEEEMADDVLGNGIYWFFMLIGKLVKGIVLLPVRLVASTIYYAIVVALLAIVWIQVKKQILGGEELHVGNLLTNSGDVM